MFLLTVGSALDVLKYVPFQVEGHLDSFCLEGL